MLKYIIYALVAALAVWAVWYLIRTVRRQLREGAAAAEIAKAVLKPASPVRRNRERVGAQRRPFSTVCFPCTLLSRPPSMVRPRRTALSIRLLSGLVGDMDD